MASESELVRHQQTLYTSSNPTRRWLHTTRRDWIMAAVSRAAVRGGERALEIGPGAGIYLPWLARHYDQVVASDVEESYLEHARLLTAEYRNLRLVVDDITRSRLPEKSFDLVLCSEVLEHLAESAAALTRMRRLLKPGGTLILSTPQRYSLLEMTARIALLPGIINLVRGVYRESVLETGHINLLTEREITRELKQAGFMIRQTFKSGCYLPLVAEFMGETGLRLEKYLERGLRRGLLDSLLWTQYYVAEA
jgi:2-polyprenyl-3-methyl-5-hydroxy-6-metoxy-1,4-benzoquinol methylase